MMQIRMMRSAGVMLRMQWRGGAWLSRRRARAGGKASLTATSVSQKLFTMMREREMAGVETRPPCAESLGVSFRFVSHGASSYRAAQ
jgi:hypothetical protein